MTDLSSDFKMVKEMISTGTKSICSSVHCDETGTAVSTPWSDNNWVHRLKSSLVIKHKSGDTTSTSTDLGKIREIAVKNNIPVSNVGVSKNGYTFINCPSAEDRDKFQPLLSEHLTNKDVVPLKEKQPHITILDIDTDISKGDLLHQIRSQNPKVHALINAGQKFDILFTKKSLHSDKTSAVARVSCSIRYVIKHNRKKLHIGINSCRVFDQL